MYRGDSVIIKIGGPDNNQAQSIPFEEAFGQHSNLFKKKGGGDSGGGGGVLKKVTQNVGNAAKAAADSAKRAADAAAAKAQEAAKKKANEIKSKALAAAAKAKAATKASLAAVNKAKAAQPIKKAAVKAPEPIPEPEPEEEEEQEEVESQEEDGNYPEEETEEPEAEEEEESFTGKQTKKYKNMSDVQTAVNGTDGVTIVQLGPGVSVGRVLTFEEAFGEHSNLFSGARAKIATKRAANVEKIQAAKRKVKAAKTATAVAKQQNKGTKKVSKQVRKGDVKVAKQQKKGRKKVAKVEKRGGAQQARIGKRGDAMRGRQGIKTERKVAQEDRKTIGHEDEPLPEEEYLNQEEGLEEEGYEQEPETEEEETGLEEGGEEETEEEEAEEGAEEETGYAPEEEYEDYFEGEASSFEGDKSSLVADNSYSFDAADGKKCFGKIHPKVREAAIKAEWNKEMVSRLDASYDENEDPEVAEAIKAYKGRAVELDKQLIAYATDCNFSGDKLTARKAHVGAALREARKQRMKTRLPKIEKGLGAQVSDGGKRIVVPEKSSLVSEHEHSGLVSEHAYSDADGGAVVKLAKQNWKGIVIGTVAAIVVIALINKYLKWA